MSVGDAHDSSPVPQRRVRILVVNDYPDHLAALELILSKQGYLVSVAEDAGSALELAHREKPDLILSDVVMPVMDGIELCRILKSSPDTADVPILLVSALRYDDPSVQQGLEAGAEGYLEMAAPLPVLTNELERLIQGASEKRARRRAEAMNLHLASIVDSCNDAIVGLTTEGLIVSWNKAAERIFGYSLEEVEGKTIDLLLPTDLADEGASSLGRTGAGERISNHVTSRLTRDCGVIDVSITISPIGDPDGALTGYSMIARDVSEKMRLEEQLRQEHKMNALGRMAGGIAHDFSNLLTAILGFCQLAQESLDQKTKAAKHIADVARAGKQAAKLTEQLLNFSRKEVARSQVADVNDALNGLDGILRRLAGDRVKLEFLASSQPVRVRSSPSQIQQVIVNLVLNARDAMPDGGTLIIETGWVEGRPVPPGQDAIVAGRPHVMLAVSDTGTGIDKQAVPHIFEPFYTTKAPGKGTGFGLATVYSVVEQAGGHIDVVTTVGEGTTLRLYFPEAGSELSAPGSAGGVSPQGQLRAHG
ncbi:MAG TPA: PAS domain S-box protein [Blastocatellia bacterium]